MLDMSSLCAHLLQGSLQFLLDANKIQDLRCIEKYNEWLATSKPCSSYIFLLLGAFVALENQMPKSVCKMSPSDVQTFQSACFRGFFEKRPQYLQLFGSIPASCSVLLLRKPRAANPRPRNVGVSTKPWTLDKMLPYDGFDNRSQSSSDSKNSSISTSVTACSEDDGKLPSNWRCLSVRQRWMRLHIYINNCHNMNGRYNPASRFASLPLSKRPILKASRCCMEGVWRPLLDVVGWKCQKWYYLKLAHLSYPLFQ